MSTVEYNWPPLAVTGSFPLPTGAATSANQVLEIAALNSIDGKTPALGQALMAASVPVTIASNQSAVPISATSLPLPTDAATSANQVLEIAQITAINTRDSDGDFTGTVTSAAPYVIDVEEKGTLTFNASGTWSGSVIIEASLDGVTYITTTYVALTSGNSSSTFSAPTSGQINTVGFDYIRFRSNTIASGSVNLVLMSSRLVANVMLDNSLPTGSNTIGNVGQSGTWNVGLNAGTNLVGKVGIDQTTNGTTNAVYVNNFPATQTVSGTVAATQSGTWNMGTLSTITNPVGVTGTFWQATQPVSASSLPLPSGAATSANQTSVIGTLGAGTSATNSMLTGGVYNSSAPTLTTGQQVALQVDANGNLKTTATFTGSIGAVNQGTANTAANAWPILMTDGTNTASVKAASTAAVAGDKAVVVTVSPNTPLPAGTNTIGYIKTSGLAKANTPVYNSYSSTSVTTSAYVQLVASTTAEADMVQIFDSSGQAMILATGSAGSEVDQIYVPPGGADFNLYIAAGTRVSIKALTGTASSGYLLVNFLG